MRAFRIVFLLLCVALALALIEFGHTKAPPQTVDLGIGREFSGDLQLPKQEIETALARARVSMLSTHRQGVWLKQGADVAALLAFVATASVTLILGWWGHAPNDKPAA